jgi:uncharacterized membrane protein
MAYPFLERPMETLIHWLGPLHPAVIHFPIVCSILAFFALAARFLWLKEEWNLTAAVLWVVTFLSAVISLLSGHALALQFGIVSQWSWIPPETALHGQLQEHALWGSASLLLSLIGLVAAWKIFSEESWPFGLNLTLGFLLAVSFGVTGHEGGEMVYGFDQKTAVSPTAIDPNDLFTSLGNYHETLVKMNRQPWDSRDHGHRWTNTYVSKDAVEAYKNSNPLPVGSWVVKESFEDDNGQPSGTLGPLYVMKKGAVADSPRTHGWLYGLKWDKPAANNPEHLKDAVVWLPGDGHLASCIKCHAHFKDEDYLGGVPEGYENP